MALLAITRETAQQRLTDLHGTTPDSVEALADLIRAEVHSRLQVSRAGTLARVARLLEPILAVEKAQLKDVCHALVREGDLLLAPAGTLFASPTRAVKLQSSARIFSSLPTSALSGALGRKIVGRGATRSTQEINGLDEAIQSVGGVSISSETWAGLERTPPADAEFLRNLDERLRWQALAAGSLAKHVALEWRTLQATADGMRWRGSSEGRLWWARTSFGGHMSAWTSGASPSVAEFVELSRDEADRARFALSRETPGASISNVVVEGDLARIELPGWLPNSEYRWLSLRGQSVPDTKSLHWNVGTDDVQNITELMAARLGMSERR